MSLFSTGKRILGEFSKDKVGMLSAAFSYGAIFSLGPLLLVLISIIGIIYGDRAAQGKLYTEISGFMGSQTALLVQTAVAHAAKSHKDGLAFVIGIIGLFLGATGITSQLENAFDIIFGVVSDPKGGIVRTLYVKLKNVALVILGGILITASLIISAIAEAVGKTAQHALGMPPVTLEVINSVISIAVFILLIFGVYKSIPDVRIPWKINLVASAFVALLFFIGKFILGLVIGRNSTASAYGAAASLVSLLLWIYYSGQILFIGGEGMKVYAYNHSVDYPPKKLNLKRTSFYFDSAGLSGKLVEAWTRGFRKGAGKK